MPEFKLGRYWLAKRGEVYYIHWFDKQSGCTKRRSTGESGIQSAQQAFTDNLRTITHYCFNSTQAPGIRPGFFAFIC